MIVIEDNLNKIIELAQQFGANYSDVRYEKNSSLMISTEDGSIHTISSNINEGFNIRILINGTWGFAASTDIKDYKHTVEKAIKLVKSKPAGTIKLAEIRPVKEKYAHPHKKDPSRVPLEEKVSLLLDANKEMLKPQIKKSNVAYSENHNKKLFASSEGSAIEESKFIMYAQAFASSGREYYTDEVGSTTGYELIEDTNLVDFAKNIADMAIKISKAPNAPTGKTEVILDQDFAALVAHEIIGHPSEADRVLGKEAHWAGKTWWEHLRGTQIAADIVNVVDDSTTKGHFGSFKYDDEGVKGKRKFLIKDGILTEHINNRETAATLNMEPNGGMRAASWEYFPLIRMTNTFFLPSSWKFEEMLSEIKDGIYLCGDKMPSIDWRRFNFQIAARYGYIIKNGELTELVRNPSLAGVTPEFLKSINAIGNDLKIKSIPNCGKGDPMQTMYVGNGAPHIRATAHVIGASD